MEGSHTVPPGGTASMTVIPFYLLGGYNSKAINRMTRVLGIWRREGRFRQDTCNFRTLTDDTLHLTTDKEEREFVPARPSKD